ncbi:hypothetical protein [Acinetobacter schindleri]|uniref:hypothetical protein n=1 Tax=Acinetobacter schindleri TaxID=108981 RepID=UPI002DC0023E|nr:hypothetical protein [Acinetobacter schindleri]MEB5929213.1 hypothetical protein [Acinetobacter schindleri]
MKTNDVKSDVNAHSKNTPQNVNVRRKKSVEDIYKALKPKAKEYRQPTDIAGLYCRVQPNGKSLGSIAIRMIKVNGHGLDWGLIQQ